MMCEKREELSKTEFIKGVGMIELEFKNKGFEMTKERAELWFGFVCDFTKQEFDKAINEVLVHTSHCPCIADIVKYLPQRNSIYKDLSNYEP